MSGVELCCTECAASNDGTPQMRSGIDYLIRSNHFERQSDTTVRNVLHTFNQPSDRYLPEIVLVYKRPPSPYNPSY